MKQWTHAQVRRALQAAANGGPDLAVEGARDTANLAEHLAACAECRAYAADLDALQRRLVHALGARWDALPVPPNLPGRVLERLRRPRRRAWRGAAALVGASLFGLLLLIFLTRLSPQPAPASPLSPDAGPALSLLGVHYVQRAESVRCVARAYGIAPEALIEANQLGDPPSLPRGALLIPDAKGDDSALGPTCAPQFVSPYGLDPVVSVAPPPAPAFGLRADSGPRAYPGGCGWMGVAGQAYARDGSPVVGLIVHVEGPGLSRQARTGDDTRFGAGGFGFQLGSGPRETRDVYRIQLLNTNGQPLSDLILLETHGDCARNLWVVNFVLR